MQMIDRFKAYLIDNNLISEKPVLIGTSGGRDSIVLCHLYLQSKIPFAIAHCNFNLRGEDSDGDEIFVNEWATKYNIPIHVKPFDTKDYAEKNGLSIQMAARNLRLSWFVELCVENDYEIYATAHHQDDAVETYLINQIRGTGLAGLHGILPRQGRLIHPLLFCNRNEITEYAQSNQLKWREDSSNNENKYLRNKVRNRLIPILKEINPNINFILQDNINRLKASEEIYKLKIKELKALITSKIEAGISINLHKLNNTIQRELVFFEIVQEFGFNYSQAVQILQKGETKSGSYIESDSHVILKNRNELILKEKFETSNEIWRIEEGADSIQNPIFLQINYKDLFEINTNEWIGQFDYHKLKFPLFLRKWKEGDFFFPIGMGGKKKLLSDYFIDEKLSLIEKNEIWLLCSKDEIVWIIGKRIDERYKITKKTSQILEIKWIK